MTAADCGGGVTYARERHLWGKGHLSAPASMGCRGCVMLSGAHPGREGRAARDVIYVIYVIYARNVIYAARYPTSSRTARSAWSMATCA
jgi:hypothetical protein